MVFAHCTAAVASLVNAWERERERDDTETDDPVNLII